MLLRSIIKIAVVQALLRRSFAAKRFSCSVPCYWIEPLLLREITASTVTPTWSRGCHRTRDLYQQRRRLV